MVEERDECHGYEDKYAEVEREQHEVRLGQPLGPCPEVHDTRADADERSERQGQVGSTLRGTFPEDTHEEDGGHRGCDEAQNRLEDIEKIEPLD